MKVYRALDLGEVVEELRALPMGAVVRGIEDGWLHGDRGWYARSALDPDPAGTAELDAHGLADRLEMQYGDGIPGWKGGEYYVSSQLPVAVAFAGDTGPYIAGFVEIPKVGLRGRRVYEPVGVTGR